MSKGLEALNRVRNKFIDFFHEDFPDFDILEQAITELKAIKETNPSEALKCVGVLKEEDCITTLVQGKALETIRQYILKAQEQEKILEKRKKALEIINKKCDFMPLSKIKNLSYDLYVRWFDLNHYDAKLLLTQQEFDLLSEVLEEC